MQTVLQGVRFDIPSPSYYAVHKGPWDTAYRSCDICYLHNQHCWVLTLVAADGAPKYCYFNSRDDAIAMIASAFRKVGLIA